MSRVFCELDLAFNFEVGSGFVYFGGKELSPQRARRFTEEKLLFSVSLCALCDEKERKKLRSLAGRCGFAEEDADFAALAGTGELGGGGAIGDDFKIAHAA